MNSVPEGDQGAGEWIRFTIYDDMGNELCHYDACNVDVGCQWLAGQKDIFTDNSLSSEEGWKLAGGDRLTWFYLQAIDLLGGGFDYAKLEEYGVRIAHAPVQMNQWDPRYNGDLNLVLWNSMVSWNSAGGEEMPLWAANLTITTLTHELQHAWDDISGANFLIDSHDSYTEMNATRTENIVAMSLIGLAPKAYGVPEKHKAEDYIRPGGLAITGPIRRPPWGSAF